jgi:hypothetical protein
MHSQTRSEWIASSPKCLATKARDTDAYWLVNWVDIRAFLVKAVESKIFLLIIHL